MVAHLTQLALQPAWRGEVAHTIATLEADTSGYWAGIRQAVNDSVKEARAGRAKASGSAPLQLERLP
jgi:hypothetical protein